MRTRNRRRLTNFCSPVMAGKRESILVVVRCQSKGKKRIRHRSQQMTEVDADANILNCAMYEWSMTTSDSFWWWIIQLFLVARKGRAQERKMHAQRTDARSDILQRAVFRRNDFKTQLNQVFRSLLFARQWLLFWWFSSYSHCFCTLLSKLDGYTLFYTRFLWKHTMINTVAYCLFLVRSMNNPQPTAVNSSPMFWKWVDQQIETLIDQLVFFRQGSRHPLLVLSIWRSHITHISGLWKTGHPCHWHTSRSERCLCW